MRTARGVTISYARFDVAFTCQHANAVLTGTHPHACAALLSSSRLQQAAHQQQINSPYHPISGYFCFIKNDDIFIKFDAIFITFDEINFWFFVKFSILYL
jgi:hypothetical protein